MGLASLVGVAWAGGARAQVAELNTTHTLFYEAPSRTHMTVYTPGGSLQVSPTSWLDVRAGWEADIVSGASVAVKAGRAYQNTHPAADVVSTASVRDLRNLARGGFTVKKDNVSITGGYAYSTEHDYRSNSLNVAAKTDAFDHNTQFEIAYARNFDNVCDRAQAAADSAPRHIALETSIGCFTQDVTRTTRSIDIDSFQGSWSQSWTPTLVTQLVYNTEVLNGFQSNPYRSVIIGEGLKAQEHHPENRTRESIAARANFYIRPLRAALRGSVRGYWDSWDIKSGTVELELEKYFGPSFRASLRGRAYKQTGAIFWSDDYTGGPVGPRGQYFTGDRELSPFTSILGGVRALYTILPDQKKLLGIMTQLRFGGSFDMMAFHYDEFTLGGLPIENARAYLAMLTLTALF